MEIQWPLVLFSLIAGTGGSLFAFVALSELLGGKEKTRSAATVTSLVLIVAGGCLSMLHLASPQNAFAALTNIFSFSGISIELMLLGLTFVVALAYAIVVKRLRNALAAKALAVVGGILGLALGYFCGHGYVIEAQPTWMHESLPLAYFGTALACGAFAYDAIAARCGTAADELSGRMPVALVVCAGIATVTLISYVGFLGFPAAGNEVLLWGGIVACGMLGTVAPALVRLLAPQVPALPADVAGLLCAVAGGVSVRMLMWVCATGYLNLFAHTVPSVMLNL